MTTIQRQFDNDLLALRRARAARTGLAAFLHEAVATEVSERLLEVNRTFRNVAFVGPFPDIWQRNVQLAGGPEVECLPDAEILDLTTQSQDLVLHAQALHWANDPVGQLVQSRRALKPDGLLMATLFAGRSLHELRAALAEAEVGVTGGLSPRVAPMADIRDLGGLLQRAGLTMPVADVRRFDVTYACPLDLMRDLRAMGETNVMAERLKKPLRRGILRQAMEIYARRFSTGDGRVAATFEVAFLTGWAPSPDQPKALRPGSASQRLASALGTTEISAGEKPGDGGN